MKQTLNLEPKTLKFSDFEALNEQELRKTEGGGIGGFIVAAIVGGLIFEAADALMEGFGRGVKKAEVQYSHMF